MDFTHYMFAFYVFLLVCGVIWFHARVTRGGKKDDKSSYEKEQRLFVMYQNIEDMLDRFEEYAEEAKGGFDDRIRHVENLIEELRAEIENLRAHRAKKEEAKPKAAPEAKAEEKTETPAPTGPPLETEPEPAPAVKAEAPAAPATEREAFVKRPQKESSPAKSRPKTPDLIQQYLEAGMSKEEIAKTLGISMREVTLIMEIKKIHA